ncbi:MAG TPA: polymer-forming cytoskeletal protein [Treponemataceae bacterium]|nr:polymer-forming cytoskeletal protein [Treponemataceae bacterium]
MALRDDISINSIVGPGTTVLGNLKASGFTRVDGDIDGSIEVDGKLIVGEKARIRGDVLALSAIIGGVIQGDVVAPEGVQLFSTASVFGDIVTQKIRMEEQVLFQGSCIVISDREEFEKEKIKWQDKTALLKKAKLSPQEHA